MNINENIIDPIFKSLLESCKPDSELKLELDVLESSKGMFSLQKKGNKIIECFPWPIGKEFSSLFSSSYVIKDQKRVLKIFKVAERITQFIAYCWLIQLWDIKRSSNKYMLTPDFTSQFKNINKPTIGIYSGLIRSISNILFENEERMFFNGIDVKKKTKELIKHVEKLASYRNSELHFKKEIICEDAEEILTNIMVSSSFLINYPMVSVKNINVFKPKLSDVKFIHQIDQLNSQRSEFLSGSIELEDYSENCSVLLVENLQSMGTYLNLSPFITNTEPFLASRSRSNILQGIYIYSGFEQDKIKYSFVNESVTHSIEEMPNNDILKKQWDNLFKVFTDEK